MLCLSDGSRYRCAAAKPSPMTSPDLTGPSVLPVQRHLFDIPDDVAFLNCAYMSPLPKVSIAAGERGLGRKAQPWTSRRAISFRQRDGAGAVCGADQRACRRHRVYAGGVLWDGAGRREHRAEKDADDRDACRAVSIERLSMDGSCASARARASSLCRGPRTMIGRPPYLLPSIHRPASLRCRTVIGPTAD